MPSTNVRRGLYWSTRTKTWHYELKVKGVKHNGNTGHSNETLARNWLKLWKEHQADLEVGLIAAGPNRPSRRLAKLRRQPSWIS
jgi:hypothetical protein